MSHFTVKETTSITLDDTSYVDYYTNFLSEEFESLLQRLLDDIPWREVTRIGRKGPYSIPRLQCWMSDPGVNAQLFQKEPALEWSESILALKKMIEVNLSQRGLIFEFDYVLMNLYRNGDDKIAFHCDDEAISTDKNIVASISLGATRIFKMVHKQKKQHNTYDFIASHGSLIIMRGDTQLNWLHSIPGDNTVTEPRINLTFRKS